MMETARRMDESRFHTLADATLDTLLQTLEAAIGDHADLELNQGVLTLELEDGRQFLVNKHAPNRQIWLSSPVSGAWHFAYDGEQQAWISTRGTETLPGILTRDLTSAIGSTLRLG